jgi:hypothetical protein
MGVKLGAAAALVGILAFAACSPPETVFNGFGDDGKKLRVVNREATRLHDRNGVRLSPRSGNGVAWVEGTEFQSGTIDVDIRGSEALQQNYVGIAFHRKNDTTYEAVYLRPFNFRAADPVHNHHAVQYISLPKFDFQDLRDEFPEQFENAVDALVAPTEWVRLRVVVGGNKVRAYVGPVEKVTLRVIQPIFRHSERLTRIIICTAVFLGAALATAGTLFASRELWTATIHSPIRAGTIGSSTLPFWPWGSQV